MKTKLLKIIGITTTLLFLLMTVTIFAQGSATVAVNPTSLDFGSVEFESGKTLPVEVTNTSTKPIRIGSANANNNFAFTIPQNSQPLNPGEKRIVNFIATPRTTNTISVTGIITAGFVNETLKKVADVALKVTGVDPFFRFNLKMVNVGFTDIVKIQVTGDPIISQLNCVIPNDHDPFFGCDMRLRKNVNISLQSNSANFQGFISGNGVASVCSGKSPCTFTLSANSELTAKFQQPAPPPPPPPPTDLNVKVKKLGPGSGRVVIAPKGGPAISTDGIQNGQVSTGVFPRGTKLLLTVTPAADSTVRNIIVSGNDPNASACNGKAQCTFVLSGNVFVEAGFNKK